MLRIVLKILPMLLVLTVGLIGVVRSEPADDLALYKLVVPACDTPCWQGIKTDVTTRQQATEMLEASPWVAQVYQTPIAITWRWSGQQPPQIDGTKDGLLQLAGSVVTQIRIQTRIPFGDIWLLLDRPDDARLAQPLTRLSAYQIAAYETVGVEAMSTFDCPVTPAEFWSSTITLGMGKIWPMEALNSRGFNIYHSSSWWTHLRDC
ncbi:MAG: hypothetical protein ABI700_33775 [Chloroflexota bacterium]